MSTLADMLSAAKYAGRNPTWREYKNAAPCDQRAIYARWNEILNEPRTFENTNGHRAREREDAFDFWHRASVGCWPEGSRRVQQTDRQRRRNSIYDSQIQTGEIKSNGLPATMSFGDMTGE